MRCASASTIEVLPTPRSPTRRDYFDNGIEFEGAADDGSSSPSVAAW